MNSVPFLFLVVGGLPVLIYPVVLIAGLMSLGGHRTGNEPIGLIVLVYAFLIGSIGYPLVYIVCSALAYSRARNNNEPAAVKYSAAPLAYLAFLGVLMMAWMAND